MMIIKQFEIWLANLNPQKGTEAGKMRPVLIVQTNLLNKIDHPSTLVLPLTSNLFDTEILRTRIKAKEVEGLQKDSDIMLDQIRAIDNKRFIKKLGIIPKRKIKTVQENLRIVLDL
ncbi:type II toxin-antitoxin system PemK/MazF family toxin [Marivirga tractuosa]|uniref:type II toxin-antitoxin system PemK/MazF family toxin n=1 Tax=Marivirga tractuosa TaxID=1006 RepID=UPI0035D01691